MRLRIPGDSSSAAYLAEGVGNGWSGSIGAFGGPYMSRMRRGASHGSCASKESITSANGWRVLAHSIQFMPFRNTRAAR